VWRGGEQDFLTVYEKCAQCDSLLFFVPFSFYFISIIFCVCIPASQLTLYRQVSQLFALTVIYRCNVAYGCSTLGRVPPLLNRHVLFRNMKARVEDKCKFHPRTRHEGPEEE